jgi:hypothetical protein
VSNLAAQRYLIEVDMKRIVLYFVTALLTFSLCVGVWSYFKTHTSSRQLNDVVSKSDPPTPFVSICELARNPELYDQKIIRTRAILSVGKDTRVLSDVGCRNSAINAECFHPPEKTCEAISKSIDKLRGGKPGEWMDSPTSVDLIGQFFAQGEHRQPEIELLEIKDAKAVKNH